MTRVRQLAADAFARRSLTTNEIARQCGIEPAHVSALLLEPGDRCAVMIGGRYFGGEFVSYDGIYWSGPGADARRWLCATAYVAGFNNSGLLTGLRVGSSLMPARMIARAA